MPPLGEHFLNKDVLVIDFFLGSFFDLRILLQGIAHISEALLQF